MILPERNVNQSQLRETTDARKWTQIAKGAAKNPRQVFIPKANGAGGGTRTHTAFYGPRILSPVRLPFRHTGNRSFCRSEIKSRTCFRKELTAGKGGLAF